MKPVYVKSKEVFFFCLIKKLNNFFKSPCSVVGYKLQTLKSTKHEAYIESHSILEEYRLSFSYWISRAIDQSSSSESSQRWIGFCSISGFNYLLWMPGWLVYSCLFACGRKFKKQI